MSKKTNRKETQGHKKMVQYLEDLKRNKYFLKDLNKYLSSKKKEEASVKNASPFLYLFKEYLKLANVIKKIEKRNIPQKTKNSIIESYTLDERLFWQASYPINSKYLSEEDTYGEIDMCNFNDNYDDYFSPFDNYIVQKLPLIMQPNKKNHIKSYPVSIDLHVFATKRDVLDFVEKKWYIIGDILSAYREKNVRFRQRKHPRGLIDFIWENRSIEIKKIKTLVDKKFPENGLVYWEIHKIINLEKRRRTQKITVGQ